MADSWGDSSYNSVNSGSSVTPERIKLLAPVHDHAMNDNATEDISRDRQKHDTLESGRTLMKIYSTVMN